MCLKLTSRAAVTAALTDRQLDPELRAILGLRAWQIDDIRHQPLGETYPSGEGRGEAGV